MCILDVFGKIYKAGGTCKMKKNEETGKRALKVVEKILRNEVEKVKYGDPLFVWELFISQKDRSGKRIKKSKASCRAVDGKLNMVLS